MFGIFFELFADTGAKERSPELGPSLTKIHGYLEKGMQTPMAQGRSTKIMSMIKWIRTGRSSIKNSLSNMQGSQYRSASFDAKKKPQTHHNSEPK